VAAIVIAVGCGKKGPPLPPLVKLPVAPADLAAVRRADTVDLQFTVPAANTDNTRPANVARVDIYAFTGPSTATDADILTEANRIASVPVKAPQDPEATFDPGDPTQSEADVAPPEGEGLDQGAVARIQETLPALSTTGGSAAEAGEAVRTYLGVGITTGGRRGPPSRRAAVPLVAAPPPPPKPTIMYNESAITLAWTPPAGAPQDAGYHVYEITVSAEAALTAKPVTERQYVDSRMTWGATRCYGVRTVATRNGLSVESERSEPACAMLTDTFPPSAPGGLQAVASEGVISLIWDANTEPDLDGYFLLRGPAPGDELIPISTTPMRETAFQDPVPAGMRYVYAVQAVDRSGNLSPISARVEETAR
jgi:hypothetical protein